VVSAYVAKNPLPPSALPEVIAQVHQALNALSGPKVEPQAPLVPAVPIKKSVTPDYIVSLEDGRKFKSMKRYLGLLGMKPDQYRQKWNLPRDYPMVAPNYAAKRSELAKSMGLGRKAGQSPKRRGKSAR
jgi:predicted transcriptional regulator